MIPEVDVPVGVRRLDHERRALAANADVELGEVVGIGGARAAPCNRLREAGAADHLELARVGHDVNPLDAAHRGTAGSLRFVLALLGAGAPGEDQAEKERRDQKGAPAADRWCSHDGVSGWV